jgi:phage tail sheath protein FI
MPLNLASPGIVVREVDLTSGRVNTSSDSVAAQVAPFAKGPIDFPTVIENENDLLNTFGQPYSTDKHYEHWMVASSYLAYGGRMLISRADDAGLKNAFVGTASSIKIKSDEHYNQLGYDENTITNVTVAAKNPGSWANDVRVAIIDAKADQILGITTTNLVVGYGVTQAVPANTVLAGAGTTSVLDGYFKGIITEIGVGNISTKILNHVSVAGTVTVVDYQPGGIYTFGTTGNLTVRNSSSAGIATSAVSSPLDWFDQQAITLSNGSIPWNTIADRPSTSDYAGSRSSRFDELHVVLIDDKGTITGNAGTILEKHLSLSKAKDASYSIGSPSYWRKYLATNSSYIYGGSAPVGITTTGFVGTGATSFTPSTNIGWDQNAQDIIFAGSGASTYTLASGTNYGGSTNLTTAGSLNSGLDDIISGYTLFENTENYKTNFILMGSANYANKEDAQALANKCIQVAETRQDSVAFISPYRQAFLSDSTVGTVTVNNDDTITDNVISFYSPVTSTTYGVFDSGYKYMYDRFNDTFRYIPLNGDIAGTCARNDINQFPWFSPAGTSRGTILNAVKLAYNPGKVQRDKLYSNRINPVIFSPGAGIILFGDKTGYGKASAFDRINVRRLFIYLEEAISAAAKDQLFEFNDEITRTNFVNIVEPFLRDVQSKRGVFDYVVVCDETNNTAAVIDNNEFVADIYIKPARSINFIGLTFIATRTGVSFEEVIGNV